MNTSIFLAKLIGPFALALGIGVLVNRANMRSVLDEFIRNRALMFIAGVITMPAGLAIVLTHNVWAADWRVLITLFGWLNAIGGAVRLAAPDTVMRTGLAMLRRPYFVTVAAAIWVVLGLLFCLFGFLR